MKGRLWLVLGAAIGVAIGLGHLPYLAGAAGSLSDTAQEGVGSVTRALLHAVGRHGDLRRAVDGVLALLRILVPGITALLLVVAARLSVKLRAVVALAVFALGVLSFHYLHVGSAVGTLALAAAAGLLALLATGPLVAMPLSALAALIGTDYLPRLVSGERSAPRASVVELHRALFATPGDPLWLGLVVLVVAVIPFAAALRLVLSS